MYHPEINREVPEQSKKMRKIRNGERQHRKSSSVGIGVLGWQSSSYLTVSKLPFHSLDWSPLKVGRTRLGPSLPSPASQDTHR